MAGLGMGKLGMGRSGGKREDGEGNGKVELERQKYGLGNYIKGREGREGQRKVGK